MKLAAASLLVLCACGGGSGAPEGACTASTPGCAPGPTGDDSGTLADGGADAATPSTDRGAAVAEGGCLLWVDDAGVTQGCNQGAMGPGDRDDGGDASAAPAPDAALDASDLGFGASCRDNAQCASDLCFDYKVRGQFCSQICKVNADCPLPSPGCNGMGVCRMPDGT